MRRGARVEPGGRSAREEPGGGGGWGGGAMKEAVINKGESALCLSILAWNPGPDSCMCPTHTRREELKGDSCQVNCVTESTQYLNLGYLAAI